MKNMVDKFTKEKRSWIMSRIRGKDTKAEKIMEKLLTENKIRFMKHYRMVGNPDFAIPNKKVAIFVDGDFWHGYDYKERKEKLPQYWKEKIERNMRRDRRYNRKLKREGWKIFRVWEHDLIKKSRKVERILMELNNN